MRKTEHVAAYAQTTEQLDGAPMQLQGTWLCLGVHRCVMASSAAGVPLLP